MGSEDINDFKDQICTLQEQQEQLQIYIENLHAKLRRLYRYVSENASKTGTDTMYSTGTKTAYNLVMTRMLNSFNITDLVPKDSAEVQV